MAYRIGDLVILTSPNIPGLGSFISEDPDGGLPPGGLPPEPPPSPPPPPGPDEITLDPELDLAQIRLYLQVALAHLGGPLTAEEMQPRSIEDIDELETKLANALAHVQSLRARFG